VEDPGVGPSARLTLVGSGTLVPDGARGSAAHHLQADDASMLLDCGPGAAHALARQNIAWQSLTHIVLTHFHNDHVGDLPALMQALDKACDPVRERPLTVVGPTGTADLLRRLAAAHGEHVTGPRFQLRVVDVEPGRGYEDADAGLALRTCRTPHAEPSMAVRIEGPWGALGYTGDTGPSEGVTSLMAGCDVVVIECTQPDPPASPTHLSPAGVARVARSTRPALVVVTHVLPPLEPAAAAAAVRAAYDGAVVAGHDGLGVSIRPGRAAVDPPPDHL
jgi:ribonuclease BN (tRNA processing enzyme)